MIKLPSIEGSFFLAQLHIFINFGIWNLYTQNAYGSFSFY